MEIDYTITLNYGDDEPGDAEPSPTEEDIVSWIVVGMEIDGYQRERHLQAAVTPAQEAKAEVYKELSYRVAGMVGVNLTVARPMVKAQGHIVQIIGPDGKTMKTLCRYR